MRAAGRRDQMLARLPSTARRWYFANSSHRIPQSDREPEGGRMPRRKSLVTVIRDMVREQVQEAIQGLLGAVGGPKKKAKNGRRRRRRRRGPGRPPGSKT